MLARSSIRRVDQFNGETVDTGVCHMAHFADPDGNPLTLHKRYAPYAEKAVA